MSEAIYYIVEKYGPESDAGINLIGPGTLDTCHNYLKALAHDNRCEFDEDDMMPEISNADGYHAKIKTAQSF